VRRFWFQLRKGRPALVANDDDGTAKAHLLRWAELRELLAGGQALMRGMSRADMDREDGEAYSITVEVSDA
jgi:hypothetical protein